MKLLKLIVALLFAFWILVFFSCKEEKINTDPSVKLEFSKDTLSFDTVFSTIGSVTKRLMIYNNYNEPVRISNINLQGTNSYFKLNINGKNSNSLQNVEIKGKDSLYVFVQVTIDPTNQNNPLLVKDSILFETNGNTQFVNLIAYGQDVHVIYKGAIKTQVWRNDKPFLVMDTISVIRNHKLTIKPGVRIHFRKKALLIVAGTIEAIGTKEEPIVFEGDRLEFMYTDIPGQWGGIWLIAGSIRNRIDHAEIKNAESGIRIDSMAYMTSPTLNLSNTRIEHMTIYGILGVGANIFTTNCLIGTCGWGAVALIYGGRYEFYHCTIANVSVLHSAKTSPALYMNNYITVDTFTYVNPLEKAYFGNCIIYGDNAKEIGISNATKDEFFDYRFDNCIIKYEYNKYQEQEYIDTSDVIHFKRNIFNPVNFKFKNIDTKNSIFNYQLDTLSSAKDKARTIIIDKYPEYLQFDLENISRLLDKGPDIGAFERVE